MANFNLNKVILGGRLTADPELKQTSSGVPVCQFSIAVNRKYSKDGQAQADFFNVTAWRATAEFVSKYFKKGVSICIVGSIQNRTYEKDGVKHTVTDIVADEASFVDTKQDSTGGVYMPEAYKGEPAQVPPFQTPATKAPKFEEIKGDDSLPF